MRDRCRDQGWRALLFDGQRQREEHGRYAHEKGQEPEHEENVVEERNRKKGQSLVFFQGEEQRADAKNGAREVTAHEENLRDLDADDEGEARTNEVIRDILRTTELQLVVLIEAERGVVKTPKDANRRFVERPVRNRRMADDPRGNRGQERSGEDEPRRPGHRAKALH